MSAPSVMPSYASVLSSIHSSKEKKECPMASGTPSYARICSMPANCTHAVCSCCFVKRSAKRYRCNVSHQICSKRARGGCFVTNGTHVLCVQSCGVAWGCPKGQQEHEESIEDTAIRETYEEAGIRIRIEDIRNAKVFRRHHSTYFVIWMNIDVSALRKDVDSQVDDQTGIGWVSVNCLRKLGRCNSDFRVLCREILGVDF